MRLLCRSTLAAAVTLALLSTASAGVNNPQSGWYSGNPLLGPSALRDIACSGSTCYASGDFGTLLRSRDGGSTWDGVVTGLTLDVRHVGLVGGSPDKVVISTQCALRRSDDAGEHFALLPFAVDDLGCANPVVAFSFPSDQIGYALLSRGLLLATTDGGLTWSRRTDVPQVSNDLMCTSETTCFAAGLGGIVRTSDGGVSWTVAETATTESLRLAQADPSTLYAGDKFGYLSKSIDGGQTWSTHHLVGSESGDLIDIACGDALHCLMATHNGTVDGPVVWTDDGGASASSVTPSTDSSYAVGFVGPLRALAMGALGNAEVSDDGGATWAAVGTRIAGNFTVLEAATKKVGYAAGSQGALVRTANGGRTWSRMSPPTDAVRGLASGGPDRLYVYGADGSLRRSDNGGQSYRLLNSGSFRALGIAAIDPDRLVLLGRGLKLSLNAGESFRRAPGRIARARLAAADRASDAFIVYGARAVYLTLDAGAHWRQVIRPKGRVVADVDFLDRDHGYLLAADGTLWKTSNSGRRWRLVPTLGAPAYALEFASLTDGFTAVEGFGRFQNRGIVLRTTDGGRSWRPQVVSPFAMAALEGTGSVDYALAGASLLYATDVGGDVGSVTDLAIASAARLVRRGATIAIRGHLSPAEGGEEIVVSRFAGGRWMSKTATAASNGAFVTRWQVHRESVFVAQVLGDAHHRGAGTAALTVRVR